MKPRTLFVHTILTLTVLALGTSVQAQTWNGPTAAPPGANIVSPLNMSANGQSKIGGLTLNTGAAEYGLRVPFGKVAIGSLAATSLFSVWNASTEVFTVLSNGNVGIGVTNPTAALSIAGGVQIGNDTEACTSAKAGAIRYTGSAVEYCNGSTWIAALGVGAGQVAGFCSWSHVRCTGFCPPGPSEWFYCETASASSPASCAAPSGVVNPCLCAAGYTLTLKRHITKPNCPDGPGYSTCDYYMYACTKS